MPFLACDIAALNGPSDDVSYVRFDTRVSGSEAQHLVRRCIQAVDAEKKVMIGFRLGDLWTDTFTYSKGKRAGEQGVSLKARLLFVSWIKVDGKLVPKAGAQADRDRRAGAEVPDVRRPSAPQHRSLPSPSPMLPTTQPMPPHWPLPSRSDPQGPIPGPCLLFVPGDLRRSPSPANWPSRPSTAGTATSTSAAWRPRSASSS